MKSHFFFLFLEEKISKFLKYKILVDCGKVCSLQEGNCMPFHDMVYVEVCDSGEEFCGGVTK